MGQVPKVERVMQLVCFTVERKSHGKPGTTLGTRTGREQLRKSPVPILRSSTALPDERLALGSGAMYGALHRQVAQLV